MQDRPRCTAHRKNGQPCTGPAVKGTDPERCRMHGGNQQKDRELRQAVSEWKLGDPTLDPGEVMLAACTVAWYRFVEAHQAYDAAVAEHGYDKATVGSTYVEGSKTGEYIRGLAAQMGSWWDRAQKASGACVAAGLAERQVRLAERQGQLVAELLAAALEAANASPEQREAAYGAVRGRLTLVS